MMRTGSSKWRLQLGTSSQPTKQITKSRAQSTYKQTRSWSALWETMCGLAACLQVFGRRGILLGWAALPVVKGAK